MIFRWWRMVSDSNSYWDPDPEALFCGGNCTLAEAYRTRQVSVVHSGENGQMGKREIGIGGMRGKSLKKKGERPKIAAQPSAEHKA